jgi:hypothetical protein
MKKLSLLAAMSVATIGLANTNLAKSGLVFSAGADYANSITETKNDNGGDTKKGGYGVDATIGYDFAISRNITVGAKTGFGYIWQLNQYSINDSDPGKIETDLMSIPLLATAKYFFNSGWLVGVEAGAEAQKLKFRKSGSFSDVELSSRWNFAPKAGLLAGYQWQNGLGLTASFDYTFGKSAADLEEISDNNSKVNKAIAYYTAGLNLTYTLPL